MKTLLLSLLLISSLPVLAKSDSPIGLFQVDSSHSLAAKAGEQKTLSGFIDIKQSFPASRFVLETGEGLFESNSVNGEPESFEVSGVYTTGTESREVTLSGRYIETNHQEDSFDKVMIRLESDNWITTVVAVKPKPATTEMFNNVREIVR